MRALRFEWLARKVLGQLLNHTNSYTNAFNTKRCGGVVTLTLLEKHCRRLDGRRNSGRGDSVAQGADWNALVTIKLCFWETPEFASDGPKFQRSTGTHLSSCGWGKQKRCVFMNLSCVILAANVFELGTTTCQGSADWYYSNAPSWGNRFVMSIRLLRAMNCNILISSLQVFDIKPLKAWGQVALTLLASVASLALVHYVPWWVAPNIYVWSCTLIFSWCYDHEILHRDGNAVVININIIQCLRS